MVGGSAEGIVDGNFGEADIEAAIAQVFLRRSRLVRRRARLARHDNPRQPIGVRSRSQPSCLLPPFCPPLALSGCETSRSPGLRPIPGSITYGGQPRQKLTKAPVGSTFPLFFYNEETYMNQPDRSLKLLDRHYVEPPF
jgi:hypothetical protein